LQIVVATDALEYVAAALKKIGEVSISNTTGLDDCLSRIHLSDSCDGLRFIGDIVKVSFQ
jgi:hypothetical protein